MTRFIHDQFVKDYLEEPLTPYGTTQNLNSEDRELMMRLSPLFDAIAL